MTTAAGGAMLMQVRKCELADHRDPENSEADAEACLQALTRHTQQQMTAENTARTGKHRNGDDQTR